VVVDDELQDARRMERAAAAVSAYGFIPMITDANPAWFTPCVGGHPAQPRWDPFEHHRKLTTPWSPWMRRLTMSWKRRRKRTATPGVTQSKTRNKSHLHDQRSSSGRCPAAHSPEPAPRPGGSPPHQTNADVTVQRPQPGRCQCPPRRPYRAWLQYGSDWPTTWPRLSVLSAGDHRVARNDPPT